MKSLTISEVRTHLPNLIAGVAQNHESIVVMRYGTPLAMIVPITKTKKEQTRYPLRNRTIAVSKDFDDPLPDLWEAAGVAEKRTRYGKRKS